MEQNRGNDVVGAHFLEQGLPDRGPSSEQGILDQRGDPVQKDDLTRVTECYQRICSVIEGKRYPTVIIN